MGRLEVQSDVRARLAAAMPGTEVRVRVPAKLSGPLVVVTREGGSLQDGLIDSAGVGIQMWADTEEGAARLAAEVGALMEALPFSGGYALVTEESLRSDYDVARSRPRWYASYTIKTFKPEE